MLSHLLRDEGRRRCGRLRHDTTTNVCEQWEVTGVSVRRESRLNLIIIPSRLFWVQFTAAVCVLILHSPSPHILNLLMLCMIFQREIVIENHLKISFNLITSLPHPIEVRSYVNSCNCTKAKQRIGTKMKCEMLKCDGGRTSHLVNKELVEIVQLECYWWDRDELPRSKWFRWAHRRFVSWWRALCWAFDHAKSHNDPVKIKTRMWWGKFKKSMNLICNHH